MDLLLPRTDAGTNPDFDSLIDSVIGDGPAGMQRADQFDDWLPDPIYYEDFRLERQRVVAGHDRAWTEGRIVASTPIEFDVPRSGGRTLRVLALPLPLRLFAYAVIVDAAPRISHQLLRDKVIGFAFQPNQMPLFQAPGEGAELIESAAYDLMNIGYGDTVTVIDVSGFLDATTVDGLSGQLRQAGVLDEQIRFLTDLIRLERDGLPSIDDAFAFLYNIYLAPIDRSVAAAESNFFRYRDEYFLLDMKSVQEVEDALEKMSLSSRSTIRYLELEDAHWSLEERAHELRDVPDADLDLLEERIGQVGVLDVWASYNSPLCESDCFELYFSANAERTKRWFFEACGKEQAIDAVKALPCLRAFHRDRLSISWRSPPFTGLLPSTSKYLDELNANKDALQAALATALYEAVDWQAAWAGMLLSDVGPMDDTTTALLLRAMNELGAPATEILRVALARSSAVGTKEIWIGVTPRGDWHTRRSRLLVAHFFRLRGTPGPWRDAREALSESDPSLIRFLERQLPREVFR